MVLLGLVAGCGLVLDLGSDEARSDAGSTRDDASSSGDAARADGSDPTPSGDATVAGDASPDGAVVVVPRCGGPSALFDRFDAASGYWTIARGLGAGTARPEGGVLRVTPATTAGGSTTRLLSSFAYDARNDRVAVRVPTVHPGARVVTFLELYYDDDRVAAIAHEDGVLYSYRLDGGSTGSAMAPYDATAHHWWQIREDGTGNFVFEASPDGTSWTSLHVSSAPAWTEAVHVSLGVHVRGTSAGGFAEFDDLNFDPGHAHTVYCPASSFADPFDATRVNPIRWATSPSCTVVLEDGTLKLEGGSVAEPCGIYTRHGYDLRSSHALLERVADMDDDLVFAIADATGSAAGAQCGVSGVEVSAPGGSASGGGLCPPLWRFAIDGDHIVLSTSFDASLWTDTGRLPADGLDTTAFRMLIGMEPTTGAETAHVAGYNVTP